MPEKRRENAVQKMLVMKQMTRVVEVHSPIQDRWLATACPSSGGRGTRSRRCGTGGDVFVDEPAASWRIRVERRSGNGSAFGMGSGAASRPGQS